MRDTHFIPVQRHAVIERPRLLLRALERDPALILLRGPGGTGKSILAAQIAHAFVERKSDAGAPPAQAVWIRFEAGTAGFEAVWQQILSTLERVGTVLSDTRIVHAAADGVASPAALTEVLAELSGPLMLILDDAHRVIDPEIEESLLVALESIPNLTVLVTARHSLERLRSPEARLRIPVREFTAADLELTAEDIEELLRERLPRLDRHETVTMAERLRTSSKGWPLAVHVQLLEAEHALEARGDAPEQHRVPGGFARAFVRQMLDGKPIDVQWAVCAVALVREVTEQILAQILDVPVHDAVAVLEAQLDENMEYWHDSEGVRWYRHHPLIAELLSEDAHDIVGSDGVRLLLSRAAIALRESRPRTAMRAAIEAEEWELLSELLLDGTSVILSRAQQQIMPLTSIPATVRDRYPVIGAFALFQEYAFPSGRFGQMMTGFKLLVSRTLAADSMKAGVHGITAAALRMIAARLSGNEKTALDMASRVQESLMQLDEDELYRSGIALQRILNQTAITLIHANRFSDALHLLAPMRSPRTRVVPNARAHALALSAWAAAWLGDLPTARELLAKCEAHDAPIGWRDSYIGAGYRLAAAIDGLERDEPDVAAEHLAALDEHAPTIEHWPYLAYIEALIAERRGGPADGLQRIALRIKQRGGKTNATATLIRPLTELRSRLQWHSGRVLPKNSKAVDGITGVYASLSQGDTALATALAAALADGDRAAVTPRLRAQALLLQAESLRGSDTRAATEAARRAARVLEEHRLALPMRVLPRESAEALGVLEPGLPVEHSARVVVRDIKPLTPSETRALLALIDEGSVRGAAEVLHISDGTVKSHLKSIYRKLGVSRRADAIRVAGEAGLLEPASGRGRGTVR